MQTRKPVVAGQFYPGDRETCLEEIRACLPAEHITVPLPARPVAGLVPHAGWTFSGAPAALVCAALRQQREQIETFVILGAAHGYFGAQPAVDGHDGWETPLGTVAIDGALREFLLERRAVVVDSAAHEYEHSIEVQLPFVQHLFPGARLLPIIVPANEIALRLGRLLAEAPAVAAGEAVTLGSTDLTHYGPRYGFTPMGVGVEGLRWATQVNDRQFIDLALRLEPERLLANAIENGNACGPGAAAATVTVAQRLGATQGVLLVHTNSNEVLQRETGTSGRESVGYAGILF
jgi:AmmeMemoRadiSam system protein B